MSISRYFIIKHNSSVFDNNTIVYYENCTYSGDCYLVSDLNDNLKREWIMYYDLYPVDKRIITNTFNRWYFDEKFDKIASNFKL